MWESIGCLQCLIEGAYVTNCVLSATFDHQSFCIVLSLAKHVLQAALNAAMAAWSLGHQVLYTDDCAGALNFLSRKLWDLLTFFIKPVLVFPGQQATTSGVLLWILRSASNVPQVLQLSHNEVFPTWLEGCFSPSSYKVCVLAASSSGDHFSWEGAWR